MTNTLHHRNIKIEKVDNKLKEYLEEHIDYRSLKKVGFWRGIKFNDYEGQAKLICKFFGLESIYDYHKIGWGLNFHISYANDPNHFRPSVESLGRMKSTDEAKVIPLTPPPLNK